MVKASKAADKKLAVIANMPTENTDNHKPKFLASDGDTLPPGIGLPEVLFITASISASHHILSAPEAPAPIAINKIDANAKIGCTLLGATNNPTEAVNTTNDITLGFSNAK
jgi:hypothetical protein